VAPTLRARQARRVAAASREGGLGSPESNGSLTLDAILAETKVRAPERLMPACGEQLGPVSWARDPHALDLCPRLLMGAMSWQPCPTSLLPWLQEHLIDINNRRIALLEQLKQAHSRISELGGARCPVSSTHAPTPLPARALPTPATPPGGVG